MQVPDSNAPEPAEAGFTSDAAPTIEPPVVRSEAPAAPLDTPPAQIGRYRVLERIDAGGMGEVYRAEQRTPVRREVAVKVIKLGMDTKLVIARFEAERQALAMMDHPHIAKVYDAGADDAGRPYFAMEYVKGRPITAYADANHLTIPERLALFEQVCNAVQHAHQKGIIHRDLKPSNVLVSTQDGRAHAKVIDFGIAKATNQRLTDKTLFTQHDQFIGTPAYMSPEQADGSLDIDTRTDVYSLGVLLYELLTGTTPFAPAELKVAAFEKVKQMIREVDPPRPSTRLSQSTATLPTLAASRRVEPKKLGALVRGELDWIVMRALEKDRARRYETPTSLADDVERYLNGLPVEAAPPSAWYRTRKVMRKYRAPLTAGAMVVVLLLLGLAGTAVGLVQATRAVSRERAATSREATARRDAQLKAYEASLSAAQAAMAGESWPEARQHLDDCPPELRGWEWRLLHTQAAAPDYGFPQAADGCLMTPDGRYLLIRNERDADLFDLSTRKRTASVRSKWPSKKIGDGASQTAIARATVGSDGRLAYLVDQNIVLADPAGQRVGAILLRDAHDVHALRFSPRGTVLMVDRYDPKSNGTRTEFYATDRAAAVDAAGGEASPIFTLNLNGVAEFSDDDSTFLYVAASAARGGPTVASAATGRTLCTIAPRDGENIWSCRLARDGRTVVAGSSDGTIRVCSARDGAVLREFGKAVKGDAWTSADGVWAIALSPDGTRIVTEGGDASTVRVWDAAGGEPLAETKFGGGYWSLDNPDSRLTTDGRRVFWRFGMRVWDWAKGDATGALAQPVQDYSTRAISADGRTIVTIDNSRVRLWDASRTSLHALTLGGLDREDDGATPLPVARFGASTIAMADWGDVAADTVRALLGRRPDAPAVSARAADGAWAAEVSGDRAIVVRDGRSGAVLATLAGHEGRINRLAISPDGKRLVSGSDDCTVRFWDRDGWRQVSVHRRGRGVADLAFTPDGTRLVVAFADRTIESWDQRDADARAADRAARDAEARRAAPAMRALIDGPVAWNELARSVLADATLGDAEKVASLASLNEQLANVRVEAARIASQLKSDLITKPRVVAAIAARKDLSRATVKALDQEMANWSPDASDLSRAVWNIVRDPDRRPESYAAALEAAEASAAAEPAEHGPRTQLALALYRSGRYDDALEVVRKAAAVGSAKENLPRPGIGAQLNDDAIAALALAKLGRDGEARVKLRWPTRAYGLAGSTPLVAEAAAAIAPASTQPTTRPTSDALARVADALGAGDVELIRKTYKTKGKVKGRVVAILPTSARTSYNLLLEPVESAATVWINGPAGRKFDEADAQRLEGAEIVAYGELAESGSLNPALKGRPQVAVPDLADVQVITPGERWESALPSVASAPADAVIGAADLDALASRMNEVVTITGDVAELQPTSAGDQVNVLLAPKEAGVMVWIGRSAREQMGDDLEARLAGSRIRVTGRLGLYGGRATPLKGRLQIEVAEPGDLAVLGPSTRPAGEAMVQPATTRPADVIDATDLAALNAAQGQSVRVRGRVVAVATAARGTAMNLELEPAGSGLLVWVPPPVFKGIDPQAVDELRNVTLTLTGTLGVYGGRAKALEGRLQLTLDDAADLAPSAGATTRPAP